MDIERTMAFIVEQRAKFEVDIARHTEVLDQHMKAIGALREQSERNNEGIRALIEVSRLHIERADRLEQGLTTMAEAHNRLAQVQEETEQRLNRLAQVQEETGHRLNDFIAQVSRYLSGGNGRGRRGPGKAGTE